MSKKKNPYQQVGNRIRLIRRQNHLTQAQLAEKAGISDNFVGLIERGEGHPTLDTLAKIAGGLKVRLSELFAEPENEAVSMEQAHKELQQLLKQRPLAEAQLLLLIGKKIADYLAFKEE